MKKALSVVVLICILFSLLCGCTVGTPEFLPGEHEGDENYVWVCKEPFVYFALVNKTEDTDFYLKFYTDTGSGYASPSFKACFEDETDYTFFYANYNPINGSTTFSVPGLLDEYSAEEYFGGRGDYYQDYFEFEVRNDFVNFFNGELPTLRFEKMTKEQFFETYGEERYNRMLEEEEKYNETKPVPEFLPGEHEGDENFVWVCKEPLAYLSLAPDAEETIYAFKSCFENEDGYFILYANYDQICEEISFIELPLDKKSYSQLFFWGVVDCYEDYFDLKVLKDNHGLFNGEFPTLRFEKMTKEEFHEIYGEERFYRIITEGESDNN